MKQELTAAEKAAKLNTVGTVFIHRTHQKPAMVKSVQMTPQGPEITVEYTYSATEKRGPLSKTGTTLVAKLTNMVVEFVDPIEYQKHQAACFAVSEPTSSPDALLNELQQIRLQNEEILSRVANNETRIVEIQQLLNASSTRPVLTVVK